MESAFEPWIGHAVVVQMTLGRGRLSFRLIHSLGRWAMKN